MKQVEVSIITGEGQNLVERLQSSLIAIRIYDEMGGQADRLEFDIAGDLPFPAGAKKATKYLVEIGWRGTPKRVMGIYTVQNYTISGDHQNGYIMTVTARASDFVDEMKKTDSESFTDMTVGEIVQTLAKKTNIKAVVSPDIKDIHIPYRLRWQQSIADFLTSLASEIGATMKVAGDTLIMALKGAGKSGSGRDLSAFEISAKDTIEIDVEFEVRGEFKDVEGQAFDIESGRYKSKKENGGGQYSVHRSVHPLASEEEAGRAAQSQSFEEARQEITGGILMEGNHGIISGQDIQLNGFGESLDRANLTASGVTHEIIFDDQTGWTTAIFFERKKSLNKTDDEDDIIWPGNEKYIGNGE